MWRPTLASPLLAFPERFGTRGSPGGAQRRQGSSASLPREVVFCSPGAAVRARAPFDFGGGVSLLAKVLPISKCNQRHGFKVGVWGWVFFDTG